MAPADKLATLNLEATWAKRILDQIEFANREVFTILQIDVRLARRTHPKNYSDDGGHS